MRCQVSTACSLKRGCNLQTNDANTWNFYWYPTSQNTPWCPTTWRPYRDHKLYCNVTSPYVYIGWTVSMSSHRRQQVDSPTCQLAEWSTRRKSSHLADESHTQTHTCRQVCWREDRRLRRYLTTSTARVLGDDDVKTDERWRVSSTECERRVVSLWRADHEPFRQTATWWLVVEVRLSQRLM